MKILITGVTGLFGSYLAKEFSSLGEIHGLKRESSSARLLEDIDFPISWHNGDLSDFDSLENAMEGMDLVIHSAGMVSFSPNDSSELYQTNVRGTANLIDAMISSGVKKLIHVSSVAAIGRSTEVNVVDENFKWVDSPLNTEYAESKYEGELEAWRGEQEGIELIVVNPSIILGKVSDDRSSTSIYDYVLEEHRYYPLGDVNYLDVRDAAELTKKLFKSDAWGNRFILNAGSISYFEFFKQMAQEFGKKAPTKKATGFLLKMAVLFAGIGRALGLSKNPLNKKTALLSSQKITFNNSKVLNQFDFQFRSLQETFSWAK